MLPRNMTPQEEKYGVHDPEVSNTTFPDAHDLARPQRCSQRKTMIGVTAGVQGHWLLVSAAPVGLLGLLVTQR